MTAASLSRHGTEVFGIDVRDYLQRLDTSGKTCLYLPGPLESLSRSWQRQSHASRYAEPLLLGRSEGATLVYAAMLQAPPLAFDAAVAADPQPALALHRDFCDVPTTQDGEGMRRLKATSLQGDSSMAVLSTPAGTDASRAFSAAITHQPAPVDATADPPMSLRDRYLRAVERIFAQRPGGSVADLPLVESTGRAVAGDTFAILYSGDGGWRDLDRSLARILADKGLPVVGVDALSYFWRRKLPEVAAADLARTITYYVNRWHRRNVALIGFSFGGNVLPFLIDRLPGDIRQHVVLTALLSPERTASFEINPGAWMGFNGSQGRLPIAPVLSRLDTGVVQCYYGEEETGDSLCTEHLPQHVEVIRKRGGHHFDENYDELADEIMMSIPSVRVTNAATP
jgi:type IV secretory pathway VirJ component